MVLHKTVAIQKHGRAQDDHRTRYPRRESPQAFHHRYEHKRMPVGGPELVGHQDCYGVAGGGKEARFTIALDQRPHQPQAHTTSPHTPILSPPPSSTLHMPHFLLPQSPIFFFFLPLIQLSLSFLVNPGIHLLLRQFPMFFHPLSHFEQSTF